jgi:phosphoglycolate phosphatase-like HAD superfamily hydrolase
VAAATERVLAVLFDVDGTLISTGGAGAVAWRRAFMELWGVPADIGAFSDAGMTDPEVGRATFTHVLGRRPTGDELDRLLEARLGYLPQTVAESTGYRVLPGVDELLPRLAAAGYLLGLVTGGTERSARIKLERGGLNRYFGFGGFGSDSPDRTELTRRAIERAAAIEQNGLRPRDCLAVGDTPLDIAAARGAGAVSVGVASGRYRVDQLRAAGADHVVASLADGLPL